MQKKVTLITLVMVSLIFLGVSVGLYFMATVNFNAKSDKITEEISGVQAELDALKAAKDTNGFTPTEVVKAFFAEVKSGSSDRAKLYLAPDLLGMDIAATLKLGSELTNINTGDNFEESDGENYLVNMTFILETEETTVRTFTLTKYDEAWKITGVTAE